MEVQRKQEGSILLLNMLLLMSIGSHLWNNKTRGIALNDLSCSSMGATLRVKPLSQYHLQHISVIDIGIFLRGQCNGFHSF